MALSKYDEISAFAVDIMHAVEKSYPGTYCTITPLSDKACWKVVVTKLGSDGQQYYFQEYINQIDLTTAHNSKQLLIQIVDKWLEGLEKSLPKGGPTVSTTEGTWSGFNYTTAPLPSDYIYSAPKEKFQWTEFKPYATVNEEKSEVNSLKEMYAAAPVKAKKVKKPKVKMTAAEKESLKLNPPKLNLDAINKVTLEQLNKPNPWFEILKGGQAASNNPGAGQMIVTNKATADLYKSHLEEAATSKKVDAQLAQEVFDNLNKKSQLKGKKFKMAPKDLDKKLQKYLDSIEEVDEY